MMSDIKVPKEAISRQIADSVDLIVQVKRLRDGSRRTTNITEVIGMEGDVIVTQELFKFEYLDESADGKIIGEYRSMGLRPYTLEKAKHVRLRPALSRGVPLDALIALAPPASAAAIIASDLDRGPGHPAGPVEIGPVANAAGRRAPPPARPPPLRPPPSKAPLASCPSVRHHHRLRCGGESDDAPDDCSDQPDGGPVAAAPPPASRCSAPDRAPRVTLAQAIAAPTRTPANLARDRYRHPAETLAFFGVKPDDTVVEIWPGGGWYTEILAPYLAQGGGRYYAVGADWGLGGIAQAQGGQSRALRPGRSPPTSPRSTPTRRASPTAAPTSSSPSATSTIGGWAIAATTSQDYAPRRSARCTRCSSPAARSASSTIACPKAPTPSASGPAATSRSRPSARSPRRPASASPARPRSTPIRKDSADWPDGVWTLPPVLRHGRGRPRQISRDRRERPDDAEVRQAALRRGRYFASLSSFA